MGVCLPVAYGDAVACFAHLAGQAGAMVLDSADHSGQGRWSFLLPAPDDFIRLYPGQDVLSGLQSLMPPGAGIEHDSPFRGGVAGFLGYELVGQIEHCPHLPEPVQGQPMAAFGRYDLVAALDHHQRRAWIIAADGKESQARAWALNWSVAGTDLPAMPHLDWHFCCTPDQYRAKVRRVVDYICAGDVFQVNLTGSFQALRPAGIDPFQAFLHLRRLSPAPFAGFLNLGEGHAIVSASPERFIRLDPSGHLETRPIKGTRPRHTDPIKDRALARQLLESEKDRAENVMIADLLRNDLGRSARIGSVRVPVLAGLESFSSVHHLVSVVTAQLALGLTGLDVLARAFPGGSITGAPKLRAMEIIAELEGAPRGPYCGSFFWFGGDGAMDSNILIRTLVFTPDRVFAHAGGGVVSDSDPQGEYDEMLTKVRPLLQVFHG